MSTQSFSSVGFAQNNTQTFVNTALYLFNKISVSPNCCLVALTLGSTMHTCVYMCTHGCYVSNIVHILACIPLIHFKDLHQYQVGGRLQLKHGQLAGTAYSGMDICQSGEVLRHQKKKNMKSSVSFFRFFPPVLWLV